MITYRVVFRFRRGPEIEVQHVQAESPLDARRAAYLIARQMGETRPVMKANVREVRE